MSTQTPHEIQCPNCQNIQSVFLWDSINISLDPNLEKDFFDRTLNRFTCSKCNFSSVVIKNLLYHDMNKLFMIHFIPSENEMELKNQINNMNNTLSDVSTSFEMNIGFSEYSLRVVNNMNSFLETVRIFKNGLSDIMIYILKKAIEIGDNESPVKKFNSKDLFFVLLDDEDMIFSIVDSNNQETLIKVPYSSYRNIYNNFSNKVNSQQLTSKWFLCDDENMIHILKND